jgi:hypothetical protein
VNRVFPASLANYGESIDEVALTGNQALVARLTLGIVSGSAGIVLCRLPRLHRLSRESFDRFVNLAFVVSRIVLYLGVFFVLRITPRGDINLYLAESEAVLFGHYQPYRDFPSSYAPLHTYLDSFVLHVWASPLALILVVIFIEMLVLPLWLGIGRRFLAEQEVRAASLLYLTSPLSLQFVAIDGQDTVVIAVLLVLALLLIDRKHVFTSGAIAGWGVAALKFLPLVFFPAFFIAIPRRWRWLAGASVVIVLVYGYFLARHFPVFQPILREGGMRSAGNLPYLVEGIIGFTLPSIIWDGIVIALGASIYWLIAKSSQHAGLPLRLRILTFSFPALTIVLTMFSKKSWPPYLMLALFPICLLVRTESRFQMTAFALFGVFAVTTESYWATYLGMEDASAFHIGLMAHEPKCFVFLMLQFALLIGYATILSASIRQIREGRIPAKLDA